MDLDENDNFRFNGFDENKLTNSISLYEKNKNYSKSNNKIIQNQINDNQNRFSLLFFLFLVNGDLSFFFLFTK